MCASSYLLLDAVYTFVYSSVVVRWFDLQCPDPASHWMFVVEVLAAEFSWTHPGQQIRRAAQIVRVAAEEFCLWMLHRWLAGVSVKALLVSCANLQLCYKKTHSSMTEFYSESLAIYIISRVVAAANRNYLQIRLCDIHERLPRVEALINKGIVIAHQVQSLEQRFESRHMRAKAFKGPSESCTARESTRYLMAKLVVMSINLR
jgi:hypothetical protein